jgi:hypothetical protein
MGSSNMEKDKLFPNEVIINNKCNRIVMKPFLHAFEDTYAVGD